MPPLPHLLDPLKWDPHSHWICCSSRGKGAGGETADSKRLASLSPPSSPPLSEGWSSVRDRATAGAESTLAPTFLPGLPSPPCLSPLLHAHMALPTPPGRGGGPTLPGKFTRTLFSGKLRRGPWQSTSFVTPFPLCLSSDNVMNAVQRLGTKLAITEFLRGRA